MVHRHDWRHVHIYVYACAHATILYVCVSGCQTDLRESGFSKRSISLCLNGVGVCRKMVVVHVTRCSQSSTEGRALSPPLEVAIDLRNDGERSRNTIPNIHILIEAHVYNIMNIYTFCIFSFVLELSMYVVCHINSSFPCQRFLPQRIQISRCFPGRHPS